MSPLSYAATREIPASIGFIPSFDNREATLLGTTSPLSTTTVSLTIHMLPASILVGTLASPNSLITGPGGSPVFPAGTTMSSVATSPALAGTLTLLLLSRMMSEYGFISVSSSTLGPVNRSANLAKSFFSLAKTSAAFLTRVFFVTSTATLPRSFFLTSCI